MRLISTRKIKKDLTQLVEYIKEHPLESLAQTTIPFFTTIGYSNDKDRAMFGVHGTVNVFDEYMPRVVWDLVKTAGWSYLVYKIKN